MRSALYYPHTSIREDGIGILKRALLMWDQLEFIVPDESYRPVHEGLVARAVEIIGHSHVPKDDEKERAHEDIEELVTRPELPIEFTFTTSRPDLYEVYPQKFLPKTWEMLYDRGLAGTILPDADYPLSPVGGLCIMGILADACAGQTKTRITDRPGAYASLAGLLGDTGQDASPDVETERDRIVAITLQLANLNDLTLESLVGMRERERSDNSGTLQSLRHGYVERIETYLSRLRDEGLTVSDREELSRQFEDDMKSDLNRLKTELRLEFTQAATSKEVIVSMIAGVAAAASFIFGMPVPVEGVMTIGGSVATVGGVWSSRTRFLQRRTDLMSKHPMAYLYEARGGMRF